MVDNGKPQTVAFNLLGSRLNFPKSMWFTDEHFVYLANSLGCEAAAIKALSKQEAVGKGKWEPDHGFDKNGLPKILYERHKFYAYTMPGESKNRKNKPVNPYANKYPDSAVLHQVDLERTDCTSMKDSVALQAWIWRPPLSRLRGARFQILGEAFDGCGFSSAVDFASET